MDKEDILKTCQLDIEECLVEMKNQQEILGKLRETGFYDSFVLLEAMNKVSEIRERLDNVYDQLKEASGRTE